MTMDDTSGNNAVPETPHPILAKLRELQHTLAAETDEAVDLRALAVPALRLIRDPELPVPLQAINRFSAGVQKRIYRTLLPAQLLTATGINPLTWRDKQGHELVQLYAPKERGVVIIEARHRPGALDPIITLQLADNGFNGIDSELLVMNNPDSPRYDIDRSPAGEPTLFGTVHRNVAAEEAAMQAGLAPGQVRSGLRGSRLAVEHMEAFLMLLGHESIYLEPLTYVAACLFERRGFYYVHGRKLMQRIHQEFQPGGELHQALDGSTPFRRSEQWLSIRGRAWAIHDGILAAIGERWDGLRMVKRVGSHAGMATCPGTPY